MSYHRNFSLLVCGLTSAHVIARRICEPITIPRRKGNAYISYYYNGLFCSTATIWHDDIDFPIFECVEWWRRIKVVEEEEVSEKAVAAKSEAKNIFSSFRSESNAHQ